MGLRIVELMFGLLLLFGGVAYVLQQINKSDGDRRTERGENEPPNPRRGGKRRA